MQVRQARERYVRWLLVTRDLSPHTIRAYDADITGLERDFAGPVIDVRYVNELGDHYGPPGSTQIS